MKKPIRLPVFCQFVIMYLAICAFVMVSLAPILARAMELSKNSYLTEAQHALDKSCELFEKSVEETLMLPRKMNDFSAYSSLKLCTGGRIPKEYYANLHMCKKYMSNQLSTLEYVDELFIYLPGSSVVLGKSRVFDDVYQYLDFDLVYQDYSSDQVLDFLESVDSHSEILPATHARVNMAAQQKYLTVVGQQDNDSSVAGALFREGDLLKLFNLPSLPDDSFLFITNAAEEPVYTYQYDKQVLDIDQDTVRHQESDYFLLSTQVAIPYCTVTLGIPNSYFEELHRPLKQMVTYCILTAILIGVLCSTMFAVFNYMPIRRLERFSLQSAGQRRQPWLKEYHSIERSMASSLAEIDQLRENAASMRTSLRANLFIRLLYGSSEYSMVPELLPQLCEAYRVALFQILPDEKSSEDWDYLRYMAIHWLLERMPANWICGQTDGSHAAVLTGPSPEEAERVQDLLDSLNGFLRSGPATAAAGLSGRFSDKEDLHTAFYHAQFALAKAEDSPRFFYQTEDMAGKGQKPVFGLKEAHRLYETIMACKTDELDSIFAQVRQAVRSGDLVPGEESIQAFYLIRTVLHLVAADSRLNLSDHPLTAYDPGRSMRHLVDGLRENALLLVDLLTQRQSSVNAQAQAQVMAYIRQNFARPDMYAASIAETFHLSRNGVYALVREQTGKSLNEYLEDLRMEHAVTLLKTTGMTVAEISAACGYNSTNTFYKVFKKRLGVPPSNLRS